MGQGFFFFPEEKPGKRITFEMYIKKISSKRKQKQKQQQQKQTNKETNKKYICSLAGVEPFPTFLYPFWNRYP
jgi:hypothetical protein